MSDLLTRLSYGVDHTTIIVGRGENRQAFLVHKDLLSKYSAFFRAALDGEWREGREKTIYLKEHKTEAFQIFQHFIYTGQVCSSKTGDLEERSESALCTIDREWARLSQAWIFGEAVLSTAFKDAVVDAMIAKFKQTSIGLTNVQRAIYQHSTTNSKIRCLLVDNAVWDWSRHAFDAFSSKEPVDFFFDLARALHQYRRSGLEGKAPYYGSNTCVYHEHGQESPCYKNMF